MSIAILSWCLILALTPLSIGLIAYCSSRPQLSRVSTKNKDKLREIIFGYRTRSGKIFDVVGYVKVQIMIFNNYLIEMNFN